MVAPQAASDAGQNRDQEEELLDRGHHLAEFLQVDGLHHIGGGVEIVAAGDIRLGVGTRQDDDGDMLEAVIGLDRRQDRVAAGTRQVEIEQDDIGQARQGARGLPP